MKWQYSSIIVLAQQENKYVKKDRKRAT